MLKAAKLIWLAVAFTAMIWAYAAAVTLQVSVVGLAPTLPARKGHDARTTEMVADRSSEGTCASAVNLSTCSC